MSDTSRFNGASIAKAVLIALLLVDAAFIGVHLLLWLQGNLVLSPKLNVERDGSFPELFNHLKWIACAAGCLWLFIRTHELLYLSWTLLFAYLLLDDRFSLHEHYGEALAQRFGWQPAFSLGARDFGELAVSAVAGTILFGALALAYVSSNARAKTVSRELLVAFGVLVFFGVGVDTAHITLAHPTAYALAGAIEDGGEMVAASVLTYLVLKYALDVCPSH